MEQLNISIWVTTICNMKCDYCYEKDKKIFSMSMEICKKAIEFIISYMDKMNIINTNIHFHGGEPLLKTDIIQYFINELNKFKDLNFIYSITTNGTIYSKEIEEMLIKDINNVSFSIDGSKKTYDMFRKSDNQDIYTIVLNNTLSLLKHKKNTKIRMTIVPETVDMLFWNIQYFVSLGFKKISHSIDYTNLNWTKNKFNIYYEQLKLIRKTYESTDLNIDGSKRMFYIKRGDCLGGIYNLNIFPNGDISMYFSNRR